MNAHPPPVTERKEPTPRSRRASNSESTGVSMDVLSLLRLLVRHWRVTAPAAVLTMVGLFATFQFSSPTYEATGSIVLLSPPEPPEVDAPPGSVPPADIGQNPFARYGDLAVVSDILARVMDSDSKRDEFELQGVTDYNVAANRLERGPVVEVTGQGPDEAAAIRSTEVVLAEVDVVLTGLQQRQGADPEYFIKSAPLEPPSTATAMYGSTLRAAIGILAIGAVGMFGLAVLAEALARRKALRPTAAVGSTVSHASQGGEVGGSNGTQKDQKDWSGIVSAQRLARVEPLRREPSSQVTAEGEPSSQGTAEGEPSDQEEAARAPSNQPAAERLQPSQDAARRESSNQEEAAREPSSQEAAEREPSNQEAVRRNASRRKPLGRKRSGQEPSSQEAAQREPPRRKPPRRKPSSEASAELQPSKPEAAWEKSFQRWPSSQETARQMSARHKSTRQSPDRTLRQESVSELPANNGHSPGDRP
jgi:hypothetical protein